MNDHHLRAKLHVPNGKVEDDAGSKDDGGTRGPASNASGSPLTTTDGLSAKLNK